MIDASNVDDGIEHNHNDLDPGGKETRGVPLNCLYFRNKRVI